MCSVLSPSFFLQVPLHNHIPERAQPGIRVPSETEELEENEVVPKRVSPSEVGGDVSNKVSMSSTAQDGNIFERTEVLAGEALSSPLPRGEGTSPFSPLVHLGASEGFNSLKGVGDGRKGPCISKTCKEWKGNCFFKPFRYFSKLSGIRG